MLFLKLAKFMRPLPKIFNYLIIFNLKSWSFKFGVVPFYLVNSRKELQQSNGESLWEWLDSVHLSAKFSLKRPRVGLVIWETLLGVGRGGWHKQMVSLRIMVLEGHLISCLAEMYCHTNIVVRKSSRLCGYDVNSRRKLRS